MMQDVANSENQNIDDGFFPRCSSSSKEDVKYLLLIVSLKLKMVVVVLQPFFLFT